MGGHTISVEVERAAQAIRVLMTNNKTLTDMGLYLVSAEIKHTDRETYELNARWSK